MPLATRACVVLCEARVRVKNEDKFMCVLMISDRTTRRRMCGNVQRQFRDTSSIYICTIQKRVCCANIMRFPTFGPFRRWAHWRVCERAIPEIIHSSIFLFIDLSIYAQSTSIRAPSSMRCGAHDQRTNRPPQQQTTTNAAERQPKNPANRRRKNTHVLLEIPPSIWRARYACGAHLAAFATLSCHSLVSLSLILVFKRCRLVRRIEFTQQTYCCLRQAA